MAAKSRREKIAAGIFYCIVFVFIALLYYGTFVIHARDLETLDVAHKAWKLAVQSGRFDKMCEAAEQLLGQWGPNVFTVKKATTQQEWTAVQIQTDRISPNWYQLSNDKKTSILQALLYCYSEGAVKLYDPRSQYIGELSVYGDGTPYKTSLLTSAPYVPPPKPPKPSAKDKCNALAVECDWYSFSIETVMRIESDGSRMYLNERWKKTPIYQKEKLLEYAGTCGKVSYSIFYDGYSGKELGRYYPALGAKVYSD